jgi:alcohol dehydrogenase
MFVIDEDPARLTLDQLVARIDKITDHRGVDVAIVALGFQETFESALRALGTGRTLLSVGAYCGHLNVPPDAFLEPVKATRRSSTLGPGGNMRPVRPYSHSIVPGGLCVRS